MIQNGFRYTQTLVLGEDFLKDTGNKYQFVAQKPYRGKFDADGNAVIPAGVTATMSTTTSSCASGRFSR